MLAAHPTTTATWWGPLSLTESSVGAPIDANGNLTADGTRTFEWDARNQLVAVTVGTQRSEFMYDGRQRRVRVVRKENGVIQSDARVIWCGDAICEERAADGATVTRRALRRGEQVGGAARFFTMDHLGSVSEVTDNSSALLGRYAYDAWGRRTVTAGADVTGVGFTGHEREAASDLWLTLYRAYDSGLGQWVSEDPAGFTDGPNLYAYVNGRVTTRVDLTGLQSACPPPVAITPSGCTAGPWRISGTTLTRDARTRWKLKREYVVELIGKDDSAPLPLCACEYVEAGMEEITTRRCFWLRDITCCGTKSVQGATTGDESRRDIPSIGPYPPRRVRVPGRYFAGSCQCIPPA